MRVSLVVAMAENRVIGRRGELPWHLPADLRHFKQLTMGHHLIMGRRTFESIGRLLPGRKTVVISRQADLPASGAVVAPELDSALRAVDPAEDETFIVGGGEIYQLALPRADRIYLTLVHAQPEGDTLFPPLDMDQWRLVDQSRHTADKKNPCDYSFQIYERISD